MYTYVIKTLLFNLMEVLDHVTTSISVVPFMGSGFGVRGTQVEVGSDANITESSDSQMIKSDDDN